MELQEIIAQSERAIAALEPAFGADTRKAAQGAKRDLDLQWCSALSASSAVVTRRGRLRVRRTEDPDAVLAWAIAESIRSARANRRWTQEQLAERAGIAQPNIARLERGQHLPSLATLRRAAVALSLDLRDLLTPPEERREEEDRALAEAGLQSWKRALDQEDATP